MGEWDEECKTGVGWEVGAEEKMCSSEVIDRTSGDLKFLKYFYILEGNTEPV